MSYQATLKSYRDRREISKIFGDGLKKSVSEQTGGQSGFKICQQTRVRKLATP